MTREEFYNLTDILNTEVLGNFMHGGEADELITMFEEAVEHSNILEQEEPVSEDLEDAAIEICSEVLEGETILIDGHEYVVLSDAEECFKAGAQWQKQQDAKILESVITNGKDYPTLDSFLNTFKMMQYGKTKM